MSNLQLSAIGFGAWAIGGEYRYGWGPSDPLLAIQAIRVAAELGINWIDTAPVYGYGHSERVVGIATKHAPQNMLVATKCGLNWDKMDTLQRSLNPQFLEREVDASLMRLGVDSIDLLQTHWPDVGTPIEETWGALSRLVSKGKVKFLGACNCSVDDLRAMRKIHPVASVQVPYNLLRREIESDILPFCQDAGIPVLAYSPMHSGVLTGKYMRNRLAPSDWRLRKEAWYGEGASSQLAAVIQVLERWAKRKDATPGQIAISWVMAHPGVASTIVGARSSEQVRENITSLSIRLTSVERQQLSAEVQSVTEAASQVG